MKTKTITAYFCYHCNKLYQRPKAAAKHEELCKDNPNNYRACHNCKHSTKKRVGMHVDGHGRSCRQEVDVIFCSKLEKGLVPPKWEHKKYWHDLSDYENEPMPRECEHSEHYEELPNS